MNLSTILRQGAVVVGVTFVVAIGVYLVVLVSLVDIADHQNENDALLAAEYSHWQSEQVVQQHRNLTFQGSRPGTSPDTTSTSRQNDPARRVR